MGKDEKISVGLIGFGYWGPNLARNLVGMGGDDVRLSAIAESGPEKQVRVRNQYPDLEIFDSGHSLINDPSIDAVVIATPVGSHYELARAALEAGKHVLVEKPLAASVPEAIDLIERSVLVDRVLMVGHVFEYTAAVEFMKDMIESGELGDVLYIRSLRVNLGVYQQDINVLWDLAPHDFSIINHLLGAEPVSVSASGRSHVTPGVEDIVNLNLHYGEATLATVVTSWLDPRKIREMTIIGSRKMLVYDDVSAIEKVRIYDKGVEGPGEYSSFGEFHYSYRYGDIVTPMIDNREPLAAECRHFIDCIRFGKTPRTDGQSGLRVVRTLAAAQASLNAGGELISLTDPVVMSTSGRVHESGEEGDGL